MRIEKTTYVMSLVKTLAAVFAGYICPIQKKKKGVEKGLFLL